MADDDEQKPIIVKKVKKGGHGHHGGAWKVAYADFVTAMMAFFLLLWLLNVTTEEQKNAISNYFDPTAPKVSESRSGAGGVLGGLSVASEGARVSSKRNLARPQQATPRQHRKGQKIQKGDSQKQGGGQTAQIAQLREAEEQRFEAASQKLKAAMEKDEDLAELSENLRVDMTPEGMRIQIVDSEGESMFPVGSAEMYDKTRNLLGKVADAVKDMPNDISIRGHTDAQPYNPGSDFTNWELSSARAHSSRRALLEDGVKEERIANVVGKADTDLLLPDQPENPKNRRISIVLLREKLDDVEDGDGEAGQDGARTGTPRGQAPVERDPGYERTKGEVQFP